MLQPMKVEKPFTCRKEKGWKTYKRNQPKSLVWGLWQTDGTQTSVPALTGKRMNFDNRSTNRREEESGG